MINVFLKNFLKLVKIIISMAQDSLAKMRNIGTMLIVAHRLSTIQHADNIIVLSHGRNVEQSSHQELLYKKGSYHRLYMLQYNKEQLLQG